MPGRTLSIDYRIASDLRQLNLGNDKEDCYPVEIAKLADLVDRIRRMQLQFPTMPVSMTKRDIASAFRRILMRPDLIQISTTDIPGKRIGGTSDVSMGHLAMPFGWVASPAYFKLHTDAITDVHNHCIPPQVRSGRELFTR